MLAALAAMLAWSSLSFADTKAEPKNRTRRSAKSAPEVKKTSPRLMQVTRPDDRSSEERAQEYQIQLEPPPATRVFRVESEKNLRERIRQEARQRGEPFDFPKEDPELLAEKPYLHQPGLPQTSFAVPHVVCYKPLYFEDKISERYGWDAGIFQPFISTGKFYAHLVALPYQMGVLSPCECECNAGYYLPGDCTPYQCYIPPWSWKGAAMQTGVVVGGIAIFP